MKTKADLQGRRKYLLKISEKTELCKAFMLVTIGYMFCYMFMLDYTVEGMNIFHRESTASGTIYEHPALFGLWVFLCAGSLFLNLDVLRRRHSLGHMKLLAFLQYTGLIFFIILYFFRLPQTYPPYEELADKLQFAMHLTSTIVGAGANAITLLLVILIKFKEDKRWTPFFWIAMAYIVFIAVGFVTLTSVFMETVPLLIAMAVVYVLNYTDAVKPKEN